MFTTFVIMVSIIFLVSISITFLYALSWVNYTKNQFSERDYNIVVKHPEYGKKWHYWKWFNQVLFFTLLAGIFYWKIVIMNIILYWILFDGLLNKKVLNREFFYIGNTSSIDKFQQQLITLINIPFSKKISPSSFSAFIKIILLISSIIFIF